jgi:hypothetical protein
MKTLTLLFSILPILSFAQNSGSDGELPSRIVIIDGIRTKVDLLKLELKSEGTTANLIFTFTNPITGEEASFEAEDVPFDGEHGFYDTFELRLKNSADPPDIEFLQKLIYQANSKYIWRCRCESEILPL